MSLPSSIKILKMKKIVTPFLICLIALVLLKCSPTKTMEEQSPIGATFKVIGYMQGHTIDTATVPFDKLTHINFSFAIPAKDPGHLEPLRQSDVLKGLVKKAKTKNVKVFLSIGGWGIGDGGGDDTRFHLLAEDSTYRSTFVKESMALVDEYGLDGIDLDWEYPDPDSRSADDYVLLMKELADSLHAKNKELTAAVVHYGKQGDGIKKEIFEIVDWLNLMAYDDDGGQPIPHAPYSLAEKSINYWVHERGLPPEKTVLGLPFYGKPGGGKGKYKELLEHGADPYSDEFEGIYYNGINTIKKKTQLAKDQHFAGVMIWEIDQDTKDETSLLKAIVDVVNEN